MIKSADKQVSPKFSTSPHLLLFQSDFQNLRDLNLVSEEFVRNCAVKCVPVSTEDVRHKTNSLETGLI